MKEKNDDLDFDFDVKMDEKVSHNEYDIVRPVAPSGCDHVQIDNYIYELSDDSLIIKYKQKNFKIKKMIDLLEIQSSIVKSGSKRIYLFLTFLMLILGLGGTIACYFFINIYALFILLGFVIASIVFLIIYLQSRRLNFVIYYSTSKEHSQPLSKRIKALDKLNELIDEIYKRKHKLIK
jgi:hypothetical protein